jgi:uncharacterized protein YbjT (DUF2867 family)
MARVLVVGASGLLGSAICQRARVGGHDVRAMVRSGSPRHEALGAAGCELVQGDLTEPGTLAAACDGVDAVVTTATSMMSHRPRASFRRVDLEGTLALLDAARRAGVGRFVYTSVSPNLPANNAFVRIKRELERAVGASGMTWTVLQPSAFMEIHAGPAAGWDLRAGRARIAGSGRTTVGYIAVEDVAAFAVAALTSPAAANLALPLTGPEPISALDAVAIAERVTGRRLTVQRMPLPIVRALRFTVGPFSEQFGSLFAMMDGADAHPVVMAPDQYATFAVTPTTFEQYVRRAIGLTPAGAAVTIQDRTSS